MKIIQKCHFHHCSNKHFNFDHIYDVIRFFLTWDKTAQKSRLKLILIFTISKITKEIQTKLIHLNNLQSENELIKRKIEKYSENKHK